MFRLWTLWSRFWSSGEILKLRFGQYFAADVWLRLQSWILVKILKLGLVKILCLNLVEMLNRDSEILIWSKFVNCKLVIWTQLSGPLRLWQCSSFYKRQLVWGAGLRGTWGNLCLYVHKEFFLKLTTITHYWPCTANIWYASLKLIKKIWY